MSMEWEWTECLLFVRHTPVWAGMREAPYRYSPLPRFHDQESILKIDRCEPNWYGVATDDDA